MINFPTEHYKLYNYIIHKFLKVIIFENGSSMKKIINITIPKYLRKEQYNKCKKVFKELYLWTGDEVEYEMSAFHELALYNFLGYVIDVQEIDESYFYDKFFDKKFKKMVDVASKMDYKNYIKDSQVVDIKDIKKYYYDVSSYTDIIFSETDFLLIPQLYNQSNGGNYNIIKHLGINIDFYFELLPLDIQKEYKSTYITLTGEVSGLVSYLSDRAMYGSFSKLFYKNMDNEKIRIIIDNIMTSYYKTQNIEIFWESEVKKNIIQFKIYKRFYKDKCILFQLIRTGDYLVKGFEEKLLKLGSNYKNSFFLIVCFTHEEYEMAANFIRQNVRSENITLYLNLYILDVRDKISASKL